MVRGIKKKIRCIQSINKKRGNKIWASIQASRLAESVEILTELRIEV